MSATDWRDYHWGRSWEGSPLEDACPCRQHPCGLVSESTVSPDCNQHGHNPPRTRRQGHQADACPGRTPEVPPLAQGGIVRPSGESTSAALRNDLAGEALNAFMAWWAANPTFNGVEAKVGYFDRLLVEANLARAELASAREELERWRRSGRDVIAQSGWIVARDGGRYCERCEGEVERGQAYDVQPGTGGLVVHIHCPDKEMSMSKSSTDGGEDAQRLPEGIVCTVTPTIQDGSVVRWYRSEIAAETRRVMASASRNGVEFHQHLTNGEVPAEVLDQANRAHHILRANNDADMSRFATHRRERVFGGTLVRIDRGSDV